MARIIVLLAGCFLLLLIALGYKYILIHSTLYFGLDLRASFLGELFCFVFSLGMMGLTMLSIILLPWMMRKV
jgi:hypothetical protein